VRNTVLTQAAAVAAVVVKDELVAVVDTDAAEAAGAVRAVPVRVAAEKAAVAARPRANREVRLPPVPGAVSR
jgi:hypothetical protein